MPSLVLFFFAISFTFFAIQSSDVFMYLALARDLPWAGRWITSDPYLYATPQIPLVWAHQHLSYLAFAGAYNTLGIPGLIVLKSLVLALTFALVLRASPREESQDPAWVGMWILAVLAASFRFIERSSLFSDLFCLLLIDWLLKFHRINRALILRLTVLFALWIQLHPGFPIGLGLVALWAAWHFIHEPEFRNTRVLWLLLPVAALLLNPLGLEGALYPFRFALHEAQTFKHYNFEWFATYHPAFRWAPEVCAYWLLSGVSLAILVRERAWGTLRGWIALFAIVSGTMAVRFVPWASFAQLLALKPWCRLHHFTARPWMRKATTAFLLAVAIKNFSLGYQSSSGPRRSGFGLDPAHFPTTTLDFLRANRIPGRLYNSHDFGAYLIWQGLAPVFHHGFVTDMDFYRNQVMGVFQSQQRFLELASQNGWTMLLVDKPNSYHYFYKILSPLPEWRIVAEDEAAYLIYLFPNVK